MAETRGLPPRVGTSRPTDFGLTTRQIDAVDGLAAGRSFLQTGTAFENRFPSYSARCRSQTQQRYRMGRTWDRPGSNGAGKTEAGDANCHNSQKFPPQPQFIGLRTQAILGDEGYEFW